MTVSTHRQSKGVGTRVDRGNSDSHALPAKQVDGRLGGVRHAGKSEALRGNLFRLHPRAVVERRAGVRALRKNLHVRNLAPHRRFQEKR